MPLNQKNMPKQIRSFSGLRFIAAVIIFLTHYFTQIGGAPNQYLANIANFGYVVSFFFILSGFCMTLGYSNKFQECSRQCTLSFLKKRLKKIYPIYVLSNIIVCVILIVVTPTTKNIAISIACLPVTFTFLQSITVVHPIMLNSPSWFIATLFFCYLATPWFLHKTQGISIKKSIVGLLTCLGIIMLQTAAANAMDYKTPLDHFCKDASFWQSFLYTNPCSRIFEYLIGCFAASIMMQSKAPKSKALMSAVEILVLLVTAFAFFTGSFDYDSVNMRLAYIPAILLLIYSFAYDKGVISNLLGNKVLVYLGNLSMAFYLLHFPAIAIGAKRVNGFLLFFITVLVSIATQALIQKLFSSAAKNGK